MNYADKVFIDNLNDLKQYGFNDIEQDVRPYYVDGTPSHSIFLTQVFEKYDISRNQFPITTLRPIAVKNGIKEILWIYQDESSDLNLLKEKYGITWWDEWDVGDRTIGTRYGATVNRYDLTNKLINGLKKNPYGRRHILTLYQYKDFEDSEGLYPCAFETLWSTRGEYIDMTLVQRSSDYLVAGHINKMQYVAFMMMIAQCVGKKPGHFSHFVQNLHIYDRHMEQLETLLSREPVDKQPVLILDPTIKNFKDFKAEHFQLVDYEPNKPQLKFELAI